MLARVRTPSSPFIDSERDREKEREIKRERDRERVFIFKRNDGCLGTF
jgi:hypothetical protein